MNEAKTWSNSLTYCLSVNSTLASIHDPGTDNFLFNLSPSGYWVGGVRTAETGDNFAWVDQSPYNYQNWAPNQPDNQEGIENRIQVFKGPSGDGNTYNVPKWNDRPDDTPLVSICQYDALLN